jgi:hypothetical protein
VIPSLKAKLKLNSHLNIKPDLIQTLNVKVVENKALLKRIAIPASTHLLKVGVMIAEEEDVVHLMVKEEEAVAARTTSHRSLKVL